MTTSTSPEPKDGSRRQFLKIGAGVVGGLVVGGVVTYFAKPSTTSTVTSTETSTATSTATGPTSTVTSTATGPTQTVTQTVTTTSAAPASVTGTFQILSVSEQKELAAIASTIIPSDSSSPGAAEAGVVYFIDNQLNGEYGKDGSVFVDGPWVLPNTTVPITVEGVNYMPSTKTFTAAGKTYTVNYPTTNDARIGVGIRYQYPLLKKDFWKVGLAGIEAYSNAAYGGNFESLSAADQTAVLTDLWDNKPTAAQFQNIMPMDFAFELFYFVWSGFLMDPMWGGNQNMVGWEYLAYNGTNQGNAYGEGLTTKQLMVASTPTRLKPQSLAQFQQAYGAP